MRLDSGGGRLCTAVAVVAALGATTAGAASAAAKAEPQLQFVAAAKSVTLDRWDDYGVALELGTHVIAGRNPLEIRVTRKSYKDPVVATQIVRTGSAKRSVKLPAGLIDGFTGFAAFTHVTVKDATGKVVVERDQSFCPNGESARTRPDAPDRSPYPFGCPGNPFTLGSVWGLQAGWATPTGPQGDEPVDLPVGSYTAVVSINEPYRKLFGIAADRATASVAVTVRSPQDHPGHDRRSAAPAAPAAPTAEAAPRPAAARPTGRAVVPSGPKPDLRALPAFDIALIDPDQEDPDAPVAGDYLAFSATVWTAGDSPLVVDGFRRPGADIMDAYQYFYDAAGKQTGFAPVGTMEFDNRDGHDHWHFTDFAQYRLLNADKKVAVRSEKEAFCLANTDAVDYTLPKANWQPGNTSLHTACGTANSLAVREVLDVGSGDTYGQYLPGQSFDVRDLPNGTYYVEVAANPDRRLHETRTDNNSSLRKVILGGKPGARTVTVPPHHGITG